MRKRLFLLCVLVGLLLACICPLTPFINPKPVASSTSTPLPFNSTSVTTSAPAPTVNLGQGLFSTSFDDRSLFRKNLAISAQDVLASLPGASIYHIAFSLADPPTHVNGVEEVRYTNQEQVPLTDVSFAIFSEILGGSIQIRNMTLDHLAVTPEHQIGFLRVPLSQPLQPGKSIIIHVEFEVTVPDKGGDYYYGIFGFNDGILSLAHAYPTILVYNEKGWNNYLPDLDGDPLFSDTSFYLVSVDAPSNLVLVASGTEVERTEMAGRQRVLYADGPARDFYLAASSGFVKQSETVGELTVNSYAPSNQKTEALSALKTAEAAIADFSRRYAPYPYTEFDIVPILTSAGGVEFPGLTSIANDVYGSSDFLEIVVTHEVGHQWFYNLVGDATQDQPWLDESMAEFVTWQYYLDQYGTQGAQSYQDEMQHTWDIVNDQNIPIGQPVSAYSSDEYVGIVYGRGPFFILALREKMGTEAFDFFMLDYTHRFAWGIATTAGFEQVAEEACNCDLTALFNDWVNP